MAVRRTNYDVTLGQAALELGVSREAALRLITSGRLDGKRTVTGHWVASSASLAALLVQRREAEAKGQRAVQAVG